MITQVDKSILHMGLLSWKNGDITMIELKKLINNIYGESNMKFVKFREKNDWEGETWYTWLQLDGNEEEINKFSELLKEVDEYGEEFKVDLTPVDESEVDIVIKHTGNGYMKYHTKSVGKFTCPVISEGLNEDQKIEELSEMLYKGQIQSYFKN